MTLTELKSDVRYYEHHTASKRGYVSRRLDGKVIPYAGKFGAGYIVLRPRWDSSQYVWCTYYIHKGDCNNGYDSKS